VLVMADPAPTWLSVGWAGMIVLILGRMIVESVTGGRIRPRAIAPAVSPGAPPPSRGEQPESQPQPVAAAA
jgi:cellulose synthase (UDP-forming)